MDYAYTLLIVDDDAGIRSALAEYLGGQGYAVRTAQDGREMDAQLAAAPADLIILDVMMPGEDGLAICRRLAAAGSAVLMLSAMGDTMDRVVGLELGAADYLAKPFEPRELLARIRAVLRRPRTPETLPRIRVEGWTFDKAQRTAHDPAGQPVRLTSGEWALLLAFLTRPARLLSRAMLMDVLHGEDAGPFDRAIDLAISRLRRKLGAAGARIETLRGEGYRFTPPHAG